MTFLRSQFSFWILNILPHKIHLLRGVRDFSGLCSYVYSQTRWQLHSKCISYLFAICAQHAKIIQKLSRVPFLTYALSLCFPSTLPNIFNGLAVTSREKKTKNGKQEPKKPFSSGPSGHTCLWLYLPSDPHAWIGRMTLRGFITSKSLFYWEVAHSTSKGTPSITITGALNPRKTNWNPKPLEQWIKQNHENV